MPREVSGSKSHRQSEGQHTGLDCYSVHFLKSWQFDRYARLESPTPADLIA